MISGKTGPRSAQNIPEGALYCVPHLLSLPVVIRLSSDEMVQCIVNDPLTGYLKVGHWMSKESQRILNHSHIEFSGRMY